MRYIGTSIIQNGEIVPPDKQLPTGNDGEVYEMFRVEGGKPLFLPDHLQRFANSIAAAKKATPEFFDRLPQLIDWLITCNSLKNCDIRLCLSADGMFQGGFVESVYPTRQMYTDGVRCVLLRATRQQPNAKIYHADMRSSAARQQEQQQAYESVLVDENNNITEGSRSNILLIKNNIVYSAPDSVILNGIMRKKVLELCRNIGIETRQQDIPVDSLADYESAFISSTPARILPIASIENLKFERSNATLNTIMEEMEKLVALQIKGQ